MSKIKGIYAAGLSILNADLSLNIEKTILHSEKIIDQGCHGVAIFGSTGQAQLISVAEKIGLLNKLSNSKYKKNYIIGTGLNSLVETVNLMRVATSLGFKKFLIMPPAYYKYDDNEVIKFSTSDSFINGRIKRSKHLTPFVPLITDYSDHFYKFYRRKDK